MDQETQAVTLLDRWEANLQVRQIHLGDNDVKQ